MKISIDNDAPVISTFSTSAFSTTTNQHWRADFDIGTVQKGSSGAPLFDQNHRVIGQLNGGLTRTDYCNVRAGFYGRFDLSWEGGGTPQTRLRDWLSNGSNTIQMNSFAPTLSGPAIVCQSTSFYANSSDVTWTATPASLFTTSSGTGSSFSTSGAPGQQGYGTITASFGSCARTLRGLTKSVRVGTEPSGYFYGGGKSSTTLQTVQFVSPGQISMFINEPYNFTFSSSSPSVSLSSYSGRSTSFYLGAGAGVTINVEATNAPCTVRTGFVFSTNGGYYYTSAPNPATDKLTITATQMEGIATTQSVESTEPAFVAALYDTYGRKVKELRSTQGQAVIDVRDVPNGLYNLRIGQGKGASSEHIQIAH